MENPRPEKVAKVEEVRSRLSSASAAVLTEYRGLNVADLARLRQSVREAGGEYRIYKNTLVRLAVRDLGLEELEEMLVGPTAIAFVDGDAVAVAKSLREFSRANPNLVIKGGVLGERLLSAADAGALADVAPREELLARLAGAFAAPLQQLAGLLQALPRNLAYGLAALIDQRGGPEAAAAEPPSPEPEPPAAAGSPEPEPPAAAGSPEEPSPSGGPPAESAAEPPPAAAPESESPDPQATADKE